MATFLPSSPSFRFTSFSSRHTFNRYGHLLRRSGFPSMGNEPIPISESPTPTRHRWPTTRETGVEGPTQETPRCQILQLLPLSTSCVCA
jgi:hypothetical protein